MLDLKAMQDGDKRLKLIFGIVIVAAILLILRMMSPVIASQFYSKTPYGKDVCVSEEAYYYCTPTPNPSNGFRGVYLCSYYPGLDTIVGAVAGYRCFLPQCYPPNANACVECHSKGKAWNYTDSQGNGHCQ